MAPDLGLDISLIRDKPFCTNMAVKYSKLIKSRTKTESRSGEQS